MSTLIKLPKINLRARARSLIKLQQLLNWGALNWGVFHSDVKPGSASKTLTYYFITSLPSRTHYWPQRPPIHHKVHSHLQRGSLIHSKPIIGSGWATGTKLTQSGRLQERTSPKNQLWTRSQWMPVDAILQLPDNQRDTSPWVKLLPEGHRGGEMAGTPVSESLWAADHTALRAHPICSLPIVYNKHPGLNQSHGWQEWAEG